MHVSIDFETYSDADIKEVGGDVYARHPSTRILCMAYSQGEEVEVTTSIDKMKEIIHAADAIRAWNAQFEYNIIRHVLKLDIKLDKMLDTMGDAAACNLPQGLGDCAQVLGLEQQKDKRGALLISRLCRPSRWSDHAHPKFDRLEHDSLLAELIEYCKQDVRTEMAVLARLPKLISDAERKVQLLTWEINQRGIPVSVSEIRVINDLLKIANERLVDQCVELCGIEPTKRAQVVAWMATQGVVTDSIDAEHVENLLADKEVPEIVKKVLRIRSAVSSTSLAKYGKMLEINTAGRVRGLYAYHGASTGRWASRGGLNAQNFPRPPFKRQDDIDTAHMVLMAKDSLNFYGDKWHDAAISCLRGMIRAKPGCLFVDADFSSIENRVSAWIAGQEDVLKQFANGLDEYKAFAVRMYNLGSIDEVTATQRQVAKSAVLGCMFGQGSKGLVDYAASMGVEIKPEDSKGIVDQYRTTYRKVKEAWYACEKAARHAIQNPNTIVPFIHVAFSYRKDYLWVRLPSGRLISWFRPRIVDKIMPWGEPGSGIVYTGLSRFTHKYTSGLDLIGSSIFQSIVQATARDFLAESALKLEEAYDIVMLTHDEIMLEVDANEAEQAETMMIGAMSTPPTWAKGFPVACETWVGNRYRK